MCTSNESKHDDKDGKEETCAHSHEEVMQERGNNQSRK
jgi:hypothetical protein